MERSIAEDPERHPRIPGGAECERHDGRSQAAARAAERGIYYFDAPDGESVKPKNKPLPKSSGRSSDKGTKLGRILIDSAKQLIRHRDGEIDLPMKVVRVVPVVDVRSIRESQGLTREQFAERYGLQVRAIQEWEQGRRKPEPAVRAYMLVIKNQPAAVRKALRVA